MTNVPGSMPKMMCGFVDKNSMISNKSSESIFKKTIGPLISVVLLIALYYQVRKQLDPLQGQFTFETRGWYWLGAALLFSLANFFIESLKWWALLKKVLPINFGQATKSFFAGLAFSMITPNRIGEYPGRLVYLKKPKNFQLISIALLGVFTQIFATLFWGNFALYFSPKESLYGYKTWVFFINIIFSALMLLFIFNYGTWSKWLQKISWLKRILTFKKLLNKIDLNVQLQVTVLSVLRYAIFATQLWFLLYFFKIVPLAWEGFFLCLLFFWSMAVVPSIALADLGIRGQIGILIFGYFSQNTIGILAATILLWMINLLFPTLIGCILILLRKWRS